jgi:hypothetical protein
MPLLSLLPKEPGKKTRFTAGRSASGNACIAVFDRQRGALLPYHTRSRGNFLKKG